MFARLFFVVSAFATAIAQDVQVRETDSVADIPVAVDDHAVEVQDDVVRYCDTNNPDEVLFGCPDGWKYVAGTQPYCERVASLCPHEIDLFSANANAEVLTYHVKNQQPSEGAVESITISLPHGLIKKVPGKYDGTTEVDSNGNSFIPRDFIGVRINRGIPDTCWHRYSVMVAYVNYCDGVCKGQKYDAYSNLFGCSGVNTKCSHEDIKKSPTCVCTSNKYMGGGECLGFQDSLSCIENKKIGNPKEFVCTEADVCKENPCHNWARCSDIGGKATCECLQDAGGNRIFKGDGIGEDGCLNINECAANGPGHKECSAKNRQCVDVRYGCEGDDCEEMDFPKGDATISSGYKCGGCLDGYKLNAETNACEDLTPRRAFLYCNDPDVLVTFKDADTHSERYDVLRDGVKDKTFARCQSRCKHDPNQCGGPYPNLDDPKSQMAYTSSDCRCSNKVDIYSQFSTYVERGTSILDDNPENPRHKFRATYKFNKPGSFAFFDADAQSYRFTQVGATHHFVHYDLLDSAESSKQQYRRRVVVENVDECSCPMDSENCDAGFNHKVYGSQCHKLATCSDIAEADSEQHPYTDLSNPSGWMPALPNDLGKTRYGYSCQCADGFAGNGFAHGVENANGCTDNVPPTIDLAADGEVPQGASVTYIDTTCCCNLDCGRGECHQEQPRSLSDLEVDIKAWDRNDGQYDIEGDLAISNQDISMTVERVTCADIPQPSETSVWRNMKWYDGSLCKKEPNLCAFKVTLSVKDSVENQSPDRHIYIIQKPVQVLKRLNEVERELKDALKEKDNTIRSLKAELESEKTKLGRVTEDSKNTESRRQANEKVTVSLSSSVSNLWIIGAFLATVAVVLVAYNNMLGTIYHMLGSLLFPKMLSKRDFENGYDAYLRLRGQHRTDRNRNIAERWSRINDGEEGTDFTFVLVVLCAAVAVAFLSMNGIIDIPALGLKK